MKRVVTLGEIMLRRSSSESKGFARPDSFDNCFGNGNAIIACHAKHISEDEGQWFKKKIEVRL